MLHPEAQKRGGYTDMKKVINMPFFKVIYYVLYPAQPCPALTSALASFYRPHNTDAFI